MDHRIIDDMLRFYEKNDCDFLSNVHPPAFPDGFDIEIFKFNRNIQYKIFPIRCIGPFVCP